MLLSEGGSHGGNHIIKARLVQGDHVDVALHQNQVGPLGVLGEVEGVNETAFFEEHRLRSVQVLGALQSGEQAAGEAHHLAPHINDREHKPGPELVIDAAVLSGYCQTGVNQIHFGVALGGHGLCEGIPLIGRGPQTEPGSGTGRDLPLGDIVPHLLAAGTNEIVVVETGCVFG